MATASERVVDVLEADGLAAAALVGAVVTLVFSVVPLSSLGGGAVAGARYDRGYLAGVGAGALAGVLAALPLAVLFVPALQLVTAFGYGMDPGHPAYDVFLGLLAAMFFAYTVGMSAVGGPLGVAVDRHTDLPVDPTAWR